MEALREYAEMEQGPQGLNPAAIAALRTWLNGIHVLPMDSSESIAFHRDRHPGPVDPRSGEREYGAAS